MDWKLGGVILIFVALAGCKQERASDSLYGAPSPTKAKPATSYGPSELERKRWLAVAQDESESAERRAGHAESLVREAPRTAEGIEAAALLGALTTARDSAGKWAYQQYQDELTKKTGWAAMIESTNSFELDFPYRGEQHAQLILRNPPGRPKDAFLQIERGQIQCGIRSCPVLLAVDDDDPVTLHGERADGNVSEVVFLPYGRLLKALTGAKEARIQITIFSQGGQILIFDVRGLDLTKLH